MMSNILPLVLVSLVSLGCYAHREEDQICFKLSPFGHDCGCLFNNNEVCVNLPHSDYRGTCNPGKCDLFKTTVDLAEIGRFQQQVYQHGQLLQHQQQEIDQLKTLLKSQGQGKIGATPQQGTVKKAALGRQCTTNAGCNDEPNLICDTTSSFVCVCKKGFTAKTGTCTAVFNQQCTSDSDCKALQNGKCDAGGKCSCQTGYSVEMNVCTPILGDTCNSNNDCSGLKNSICINNKCVCGAGFTANSGSCDVASVVGRPCTSNTDCSGIQYTSCTQNTCSCQKGYENFKGVCQASSVVGRPCSSTTDCGGIQNVMCAINSRICTCKPGYISKMGACQDIDECASVTICGSVGAAKCTNTEGSYNCTCNNGYIGGGKATPCIKESIKTDCEKAENMYYNGHCYIAYQYKPKVKISYADAEQTCKTLGGKLAEWKDLETQLEVSNMYNIKGATQCLLGGVINNADGTVNFSDGSKTDVNEFVWFSTNHGFYKPRDDRYTRLLLPGPAIWSGRGFVLAKNETSGYFCAMCQI